MSYEVGEKVEVHAFGHWYEGQVVKVARKLVHVRYTSGTGTTRTKAVGDDLIRKLDPQDIEPVTLFDLPEEERRLDHKLACDFAGCRVRHPE
jgi:hypothetical protein